MKIGAILVLVVIIGGDVGIIEVDVGKIGVDVGILNGYVGKIGCDVGIIGGHVVKTPFDEKCASFQQLLGCHRIEVSHDDK